MSAKVKPRGNELARVDQDGVALTVPDYLKDFNGPTGAEGIASEDVNVPRLKIGQDMSKPVQQGHVKRGDLFLNVTEEVVCKEGEALPFIVLGTAKEYILWRPQEDNGGGILARAKPIKTDQGVRYAWDKPNQKFEVKVGGKVKVTWATKNFIDEDGLNQWGTEIPGESESKPAATEHHNYVVILPSRDDMICALSLSRSATPRAKDLNAMLKMGTVPLTSRRFTVETADGKGDREYKTFKFRQDGFVANKAAYERYAKMADAFKGKTINVDQTDGGDDEADDRV